MSYFKPKCTKFDFGWAPPQTPLRAYSTPQTFTAGGCLLQEGKETREGIGRKRERERREGKRYHKCPVFWLYVVGNPTNLAILTSYDK